MHWRLCRRERGAELITQPKPPPIGSGRNFTAGRAAHLSDAPALSDDMRRGE
jgi:hypothetical protein